jgi:hypothetical protein
MERWPGPGVRLAGELFSTGIVVLAVRVRACTNAYQFVFARSMLSGR